MIVMCCIEVLDPFSSKIPAQPPELCNVQLATQQSPSQYVRLAALCALLAEESGRLVGATRLISSRILCN